MNCTICDVSFFDKPLHRTRPTGQPDAGWMCEECLNKNEPELHNNLKEDGDFQQTNDISKAINLTKK